MRLTHMLDLDKDRFSGSAGGRHRPFFRTDPRD